MVMIQKEKKTVFARSMIVQKNGNYHTVYLYKVVVFTMFPISNVCLLMEHRPAQFHLVICIV